MSEVDANDFLMSGGVKSAKFLQVGDSITGTIARRPETQQQRDFATGSAKFWDDGKPMMQLRIILQTSERDPDDPDDTGERALYVKSGMREAIATAVKAAPAKGLEVGGKLQVTYSGDGKAAQKGFNPPKQYQAKYKAPAAGSVPLQEPEPAPADDVDMASIPF